MKLVRFGPAGREKPGIIDGNGRIRDLSKVVPDIAGDALSPKGLAKIRKGAIANDTLMRGLGHDNLNILVDGGRIYGACPSSMDPRP